MRLHRDLDASPYYFPGFIAAIAADFALSYYEIANFHGFVLALFMFITITWPKYKKDNHYKYYALLALLIITLVSNHLFDIQIGNGVIAGLFFCFNALLKEQVRKRQKIGFFRYLFPRIYIITFLNCILFTSINPDFYNISRPLFYSFLLLNVLSCSLPIAWIFKTKLPLKSHFREIPERIFNASGIAYQIAFIGGIALATPPLWFEYVILASDPSMHTDLTGRHAAIAIFIFGTFKTSFFAFASSSLFYICVFPFLFNIAVNITRTYNLIESSVFWEQKKD